jgi:hypothetical protein
LSIVLAAIKSQAEKLLKAKMSISRCELVKEAALLAANIDGAAPSQGWLRLDSLRNDLATMADDDPFVPLIAAALFQASGQETRSGHVLEGFLLEHKALFREHPLMLNRLAEVTFRLERHDLLEEVFVSCFNVEFCIGFYDGGIAGVVRWIIPASGGRSEFRFCRDIYRHPFFDVLLKHWIQLIPLYAFVLRRNHGIHGSIAINLEDFGNVPGLAFCDYRDEFTLIPDPIFMGTLGYSSMKSLFNDDAKPWAERRPVAVWRGATTGFFDCRGRPISDWRQLPRIQLCSLATSRDDIIDAGITGIIQSASSATSDIEAAGLCKPFMPPKDFQDFKYQIDIDGNSSAWPGLFLKLCSGSPVLKVASGVGFRQWYYDRLVAWINYVPVSADLSDLVDKVEWLRLKDDLAQQIGSAGKQLACSMTPDLESLLCERAIVDAIADAARQS